MVVVVGAGVVVIVLVVIVIEVVVFSLTSEILFLLSSDLSFAVNCPRVLFLYLVFMIFDLYKSVPQLSEASLIR